MDRFLRGLDPDQQAAVTSTATPLCVIAPAGSGKTRVLTRRIGYQAEAGELDTRRTLAVTFTRKAAGELRERLAALGLRDTPIAGTFHSIAFGLLRTRWADQGIAAPALLDRRGSFLTRNVQPHFERDGSRVNPLEAAAEIEWAKARGITPDDYPGEAQTQARHTSAHPERIARWFARYEEVKRERRMVDFEDLLRYCIAALDRDEEFAASVRWRYRHLLVDEFQDVNPLQFRLLEGWLGARTDICVVGDPTQAIYGWNGADAGYLREFTSLFPTTTVIRLKRNYRSTPSIMAVAASVLHPEDTPDAVATRPDGPTPTVTAYVNADEEAAGIARHIRDQRATGRPWSAQAVLCRTNAQTAKIVEALAAAGIPHALRLGALSRDPDVRRLLETIRQAPTFEMGLIDLESGDLGTDGGEPIPDETRTLLATVAREYVGIDADPSTERFKDWLSTAGADDTNRRAVTVGTFHAAKGLEWPVVHVAGLEQGFVPSVYATTPEAEAEERRLLYVALTRATEEVSCSWARSRRFNDTESIRSPSPFLASIEQARAELGASVRHDPRRIAELRDQVAPIATSLLSGSAEIDPALRALHAWRERVCRTSGVKAQTLVDDALLADIAEKRPRTAEELAAISGVGPIRARRLADGVLDALENA